MTWYSAPRPQLLNKVKGSLHYTVSQQILSNKNKFQTGEPWVRMPCSIPRGKGHVLPKCRKMKWKIHVFNKISHNSEKKYHDATHLKYIRHEWYKNISLVYEVINLSQEMDEINLNTLFQNYQSHFSFNIYHFHLKCSKWNGQYLYVVCFFLYVSLQIIRSERQFIKMTRYCYAQNKQTINIWPSSLSDRASRSIITKRLRT